MSEEKRGGGGMAGPVNHEGSRKESGGQPRRHPPGPKNQRTAAGRRGGVFTKPAKRENSGGSEFAPEEGVAFAVAVLEKNTLTERRRDQRPVEGDSLRRTLLKGNKPGRAGQQVRALWFATH